MRIIKIKSERGMSLVELMVTMAISTVVMMAIGNSLLSLYQHQATIGKKDQANEFSASFSRVVHQNVACTEMLAGVVMPISGAPTSFIVEDYLTHQKQAATVDPTKDDLIPGEDIYPGLRLQSLTITNSSLPDQAVVYAGVAYKRRIAEIEMVLAVVGGNGVRELKPRRFQVPVLVNNTDEIMRCSSEMDVEDACGVM